MAHTSATIEKELAEIRAKVSEISNVKVITCCQSQVRFKITKNRVKELDVVLQFPNNYPDSLILMENKSRTLPVKFLDSIAAALEKEKQAFVGKPHVILSLRFVLDFVETNTLCYCVQEISNLKKFLNADSSPTSSKDYFKVRQKQSCVVFRVERLQYFVDVKVTVPEDYPYVKIDIEVKDSNFPALLVRYFQAQANETARRAVEPPLLRRKKGQKAPPRPVNFEPKPSLEEVGTFLIDHAKKYPVEDCGFCHKRVFPADPKQLAHKQDDPNSVQRVYCDHIFHFTCIDEFMNRPPFDGKKCPVCESPIYHDNWKASEKTREERWAHKQAKQRELEDVEDFLK